MKSEHEPCAYCGARPAWPMMWRHDNGTTYILHLCAVCESNEAEAFEGWSLSRLDRPTSREDGLAKG
jgi:hypothetical protein